MRYDERRPKDRGRPAGRFPVQTERGGTIRSIGDVVGELLAQYQERFPEVRVCVVETPAEEMAIAG